MENVLENSRKVFVELQEKKNKLQEKIYDYERKIGRLENRISKIQENNWWCDKLIRPVMDELRIRLPELKWDDERLVPMGMRSAVSVFGHIEGKCVASLVFTIGDYDNGVLQYDYAKKESDSEISPTSIYALNGFDNMSKDVESIDELVKYIQTQLKEIVNG